MLIITPGFAADESDDSCIPPLQMLVRGLQQRGTDIRVIALEYPFRFEPYLWHGVPVFPCNGQNRRWLRWRTRARAIRLAENLIQNENVQKIHSFWLGQAWQIGKALAKRHPVAHFTTLMGQDVLTSVNGRYLRQLLPNDFLQLIALSSFHADQLALNAGQHPGHIIPWGIDAKAFSSLQSFDSQPDIIGVGSLIPVKNWGLWIETIAVIAQIHPSIKAVLVGDGPDKQQLLQRIHQLGLAKNIRLTGQLSRAATLQWMASAKVLLHTSLFESFGYVLAEAAAAGCRVVSTPVGIADSLGRTGTIASELADGVIHALNERSREAQMPWLMEQTLKQYLMMNDK